MLAGVERALAESGSFGPEHEGHAVGVDAAQLLVPSGREGDEREALELFER